MPEALLTLNLQALAARAFTLAQAQGLGNREWALSLPPLRPKEKPLDVGKGVRIETQGKGEPVSLGPGPITALCQHLRNSNPSRKDPAAKVHPVCCVQAACWRGLSPAWRAALCACHHPGTSWDGSTSRHGAAAKLQAAHRDSVPSSTAVLLC